MVELMRNGTGFVLPIAFSWKVARAGYRWIDSKGKRFLCAVDALQPDWHNMFDRYERTYRPLGERTGLFREFGELKPTEPDILAFANRSGLLKAIDYVELHSKSGPVSVHGDSLQLWQELQFSAAVGALKTFNKCQQCLAPFELSRDPQTGKRRDARFCSARCRVGHYRGRKEQARRLNSTGMSAQQIARELNTTAGTVRGWLRSVERGGPGR